MHSCCKRDGGDDSGYLIDWKRLRHNPPLYRFPPKKKKNKSVHWVLYWNVSHVALWLVRLNWYRNHPHRFEQKSQNQINPVINAIEIRPISHTHTPKSTKNPKCKHNYVLRACVGILLSCQKYAKNHEPLRKKSETEDEKRQTIKHWWRSMAIFFSFYIRIYSELFFSTRILVGLSIE